MKKEEVTAKIYHLCTRGGDWLGEVIITSDGIFSGTTDWGNLTCRWNSFSGDFRDFILGINVSYFGGVLFGAISYISHSRETEKGCYRFAEKILPALQLEIKEELNQESLTKVTL